MVSLNRHPVRRGLSSVYVEFRRLFGEQSRLQLDSSQWLSLKKLYRSSIKISVWSHRDGIFLPMIWIVIPLTNNTHAQNMSSLAYDSILEGLPKELLFYNVPVIQTAVSESYYVDCRPVSQISESFLSPEMQIILILRRVCCTPKSGYCIKMEPFSKRGKKSDL